MNINVSALKGRYDAFNLNDGRVGAPLNPIPNFMTMMDARGNRPIHSGDAVPIQLDEVHSFENTVGEPLEFMVIGVASSKNKSVDSIDVKDTRVP